MASRPWTKRILWSVMHSHTLARDFATPRLLSQHSGMPRLLRLGALFGRRGVDHTNRDGVKTHVGTPAAKSTGIQVSVEALVRLNSV